VLPAAAMALTTSVVGSAGLVAGVSGAGIMSGLAAYGAMIGGGAVAGMLVLGAAPALTSVTIMNHALRRDDDLPRPEQAARTAGRIGSAAGALAGAAGSIATVSALGIPGLSAAGISSGLAAIGAAATGGGMAAGTICVVAAPAAIAAIAGYLIYRLALWLTTPARECRLPTGTTVARLPEPRPQPVAQEPEPRCPASTGVAHAPGSYPANEPPTTAERPGRRLRLPSLSPAFTW
jgi:hypothetical protein